MLNKIHYTHLGVKKCLSLAKQSIFWPTMANEVKQMIESCYTCIKYSKSQMSEELKSHEIKMLPWNKIGCDLFELQRKKYLIIIDYYSKFIEIEELEEGSDSCKVVNILKAIFARHGIPLIVISDGGPQFTSQIFKRFAREWEFTHILTSPTYAQSNGMAERNVQTAKNIFKKVLKEQKDIYLALLNYRNTPIFENFSPSQILMSRKLRSTIPTNDKELIPKIINREKFNNIFKKKVTQQYYYNKKGIKALSELDEGTKIVVQLKPKGSWIPGIIKQKVRERTYIVKTNNGSEYIRNRKFIKINKYRKKEKITQNPCLFNPPEREEKEETKKCYIEIEEEKEGIEEEKEDKERSSEGGGTSEEKDDNESDSGESQSDRKNTTTTRSGRIVKQPEKLDL
ncbi:unnamed protein product [Lasius platythorax]|uniref:RNA-directed DNA polymerase n=1 Tax=Lasius platythorax TaxID=488582 RepID=A0AAV2MYZ1_9HYME